MLKLARARAHIETIKTLTQGGGYRFVPITENGKRYLELRLEADPMATVVVGEVLYHLRSSLDHMLILLLSAQRGMAALINQKLYFPTSEHNINERTEDLTEGQKTLIREFFADERTKEWLADLNTMRNKDVHVGLHIVASENQVMNLVRVDPRQGFPVGEFFGRWAAFCVKTDKYFEDGMRLEVSDLALTNEVCEGLAGILNSSKRFATEAVFSNPALPFNGKLVVDTLTIGANVVEKVLKKLLEA